MAAEQAAFLHAEQALGDGGIGQQLPAALVVEIAGQRGDDAVLAEQQAHARQLLAELALQRQEIADLVVAIGDIDPDIAIEDLLALDAELARIGMHGDEPVALRQVAAEHRLLVGPVMDVFGIDEADVAGVAAQRLGMVDQQLDEEVALVARQFDREIGIMGEEGGHHIAHDQLLGQRRIMNAADAGEVRLHEMQRVLPAGGGEIADRVEPPIDGVQALMPGRPAVPDPGFFPGGDRDDVPDPLIFQIEGRRQLQRLDNGEADMMHIAQLLGHGQQRARHDAHRLRNALMLIDHLMAQRIGLQALSDALKHRIADLMHGPTHPALEGCPGKAKGFSRAQHGRLDVMVVPPPELPDAHSPDGTARLNPVLYRHSRESGNPGAHAQQFATRPGSPLSRG